MIGCGNAGTDDDGFVERDTAGIAMAESRAPAWQQGRAWSIEATPTVRIGIVDGAPEYHFEHAPPWRGSARRSRWRLSGHADQVFIG